MSDGLKVYCAFSKTKLCRRKMLVSPFSFVLMYDHVPRVNVVEQWKMDTFVNGLKGHLIQQAMLSMQTVQRNGFQCTITSIAVNIHKSVLTFKNSLISADQGM